MAEKGETGHCYYCKRETTSHCTKCWLFCCSEECRVKGWPIHKGFCRSVVKAQKRKEEEEEEEEKEEEEEEDVELLPNITSAAAAESPSIPSSSSLSPPVERKEKAIGRCGRRRYRDDVGGFAFTQVLGRAPKEENMVLMPADERKKLLGERPVEKRFEDLNFFYVNPKATQWMTAYVTAMPGAVVFKRSSEAEGINERYKDALKWMAENPKDTLALYLDAQKQWQKAKKYARYFLLSEKAPFESVIKSDKPILLH